MAAQVPKSRTSGYVQMQCVNSWPENNSTDLKTRATSEAPEVCGRYLCHLFLTDTAHLHMEKAELFPMSVLWMLLSFFDMSQQQISFSESILLVVITTSNGLLVQT